MASDAALLALIVDDSHALSVLAAWAAIAPRLDHIDDNDVLMRLMELTSTHGTDRVSKSLKRLLAARVIIDGGITDLADKMLQTIVQCKLGTARGRK